MKKLLFISCLTLAVVGCNNNATKDAAASKDSISASSVSTEKMEYPFTPGKPYQNWQMGKQQNAITVMKGLKAFQDGDINGCIATFGDSVEIRFDYLQTKLSNDSLKKFFAKQRDEYSSIVIKMEDWEPVISSDKKEEWVTLWYKQIMTDKKGKTDSLAVIDDCKMLNGKIVTLDEKTQHYQVTKK